MTKGDQVMLTPDYKEHSDAAGGPLSPGDVGKVVEVKPTSSSSQPYKVEYNGRTWWYKAEAIVKSGATSGRPSVGGDVMLTADYKDYSDAAGGPLSPGDVPPRRHRESSAASTCSSAHRPRSTFPSSTQRPRSR